MLAPLQNDVVLRGYPSPLLDFDFVNGRYRQDTVGANTYAADFLTTSRASVGYADTAAGAWVRFANNVARITDKGLLVEEARTNSLRNNSMQGAIAGTPGILPTNWIFPSAAGATTSVIGVGTDNGIDYIDVRLSGVTTSGVVRYRTDAVTASAGQVWASSLFLKVAAGSLTNITTVQLKSEFRNAGSAIIDSVSLVIVPTGTIQRSTSITAAAPATTADARQEIQILFNVGVAIDLTLRIGWPQLELGSFATSPIRTTAAAATRAAEVVTVTTSPVFGSAYTLFGQGNFLTPTTYFGGGTQPMTLVNISDGTELNRARIQRTNSSGTPARAQLTVANVSTIVSDAGTWLQFTSGKVAATFRGGDQALSFNGGMIGTSAATAVIAPNKVNLGSQGDGAQIANGYIEHIALWPTTRLSNANLQLLTGPAPMGEGGTLNLPDLDFDFVGDKYYNNASYGTLAAAITVSRASVGYADDLAGVWTSFGNNVARRTNKGLLVEEARTNSIRNNSMQGAAAGTPGILPTNWLSSIVTNGLTQTIVGVGVQNGVDYIDVRIQGIATIQNPYVSFEGIVNVAATTGQNWALSCFVALAGGTVPLSLRLTLTEKTSGGANVIGNTGNNQIFLTPTLTRVSDTFTLSGGPTTAFIWPAIRTTIVVGTPVDFTLRIGWPQLELGAFATSPIRTTAAAATRAADVVTVTTSPSFGSAYSLFGKGTPISPTTFSTIQYFLNIDDGTPDNRFTLFRSSTNGFGRMTSVSGTVAPPLTASVVWAQGVSGKLAGAAAAGDQQGSFNGTLGDALTGALPVNVSIFRLGGRNVANSFFNGYIEGVVLWPTTRLSNSQLQGITAP